MQDDLHMIADLPAKHHDSKLTAEFEIQKLRENWQRRRRKDPANIIRDAAQRVAQSSMHSVRSSLSVALLKVQSIILSRWHASIKEEIKDKMPYTKKFRIAL